MADEVDRYDAEDIVEGLGEYRLTPGATLTERIMDGISSAWDKGTEDGYLEGVRDVAQALGFGDLAASDNDGEIIEEISKRCIRTRTIT